MKTTVTCPNWKECRSHRLVVKLSQNCRWNWIDEHLLIHHQINVDYSQWQTFTIALSITLKFHNVRKIEQTTKHHWLGCIMPIQQRNSIFVFYSTFQEHTVSKYQFFSLCMFFFSPFDIKKENVSNKNCTFYANFWSHQSKLFTFVYSKLVRPSYFVFVFLSLVHQQKNPRFLFFYSVQVFFVTTVTNSTQLLVFEEKSQISALIHIYK